MKKLIIIIIIASIIILALIGICYFNDRSNKNKISEGKIDYELLNQDSNNYITENIIMQNTENREELNKNSLDNDITEDKNITQKEHKENKTTNDKNIVNNSSDNKNTEVSTKKEENNVKTEEKIENINETKPNEESNKNTHNTEEKENTETEKIENKQLANTFFSRYNKEKTQEAVDYINMQMKKDELYKELGGYAVAVTYKPTNNWMSYSSNSKLDAMALAGCKVSVYVENYYRYNSKGTDYYLYDTKIYIYQEVI